MRKESVQVDEPTAELWGTRESYWKFVCGDATKKNVKPPSGLDLLNFLIGEKSTQSFLI